MCIHKSGEVCKGFRSVCSYVIPSGKAETAIAGTVGVMALIGGNIGCFFWQACHSSAIGSASFGPTAMILGSALSVITTKKVTECYQRYIKKEDDVAFLSIHTSPAMVLAGNKPSHSRGCSKEPIHLPGSTIDPIAAYCWCDITLSQLLMTQHLPFFMMLIEETGEISKICNEREFADKLGYQESLDLNFNQLLSEISKEQKDLFLAQWRERGASNTIRLELLTSGGSDSVFFDCYFSMCKCSLTNKLWSVFVDASAVMHLEELVKAMNLLDNAIIAITNLNTCKVMATYGSVEAHRALYGKDSIIGCSVEEVVAIESLPLCEEGIRKNLRDAQKEGSSIAEVENLFVKHKRLSDGVIVSSRVKAFRASTLKQAGQCMHFSVIQNLSSEIESKDELLKERVRKYALHAGFAHAIGNDLQLLLPDLQLRRASGERGDTLICLDRWIHILENINKLQQTARDYGSLFSEHIKLVEVQADYNDVIKEVITSQLSIIELKHQNILINISTSPSSERALLFGDFARFRDIIYNVIDNSRKYVYARYEGSGGNINISIDEISEDDEHVSVKIEVVDDGLGISEHNVFLLQESYDPQIVSPHKGVEGTGYGWVSNKKNIELIGGSISIDSDGINMGTTVLVEVSFNKKPIEVDVVADASPCMELSFENVLFTRDSYRFLIVDDVVQSHKILVRQICHCLVTLSKKYYGDDYKVNARTLSLHETILDLTNIESGEISSITMHFDFADDGDVAVPMFENSLAHSDENNTYYAAMFMDWNMGRMNGPQAIQICRQKEEAAQTKHVICFACTANVVEIQDARQMKFDEVLGKPFNISILTKLLTNLLQYLR